MLMKKCISLAKLAEGQVSPNPLVGAIVLDKYNNVISKGYHEQYGQNHAERNALINLPNDLTDGGTVIVNLEPCSHFGKTPPCADLIIEKKIKKVIVGMRDVNPVVAGNGIKKLTNAGIEVVEGVLEDECKKLNEVFIKNMIEHKSFVAIKTATTLDGKIAASNGLSKWITSENARDEVRNIRKRYDAILTSASTVNADNPEMKHKNKIILDRKLKTDFTNSKIYNQGNCYVFYDENISHNTLESKLNSIENNNSIRLLPAKINDDKLDLKCILDKIYELGIMSILVESGGRLNGSFLKYADKIYQFIAPKIIGDNKGLSCFDFRSVTQISEAVKFTIDSVDNYKPDILITLYPTK